MRPLFALLATAALSAGMIGCSHSKNWHECSSCGSAPVSGTISSGGGTTTVSPPLGQPLPKNEPPMK